MPTTISDEATAEAHQWEVRYLRGECSLFEALCGQMSLGAPVSGLLFDAFMHAQFEYQAGKFSDLAEPLGVAMTQREKKHWERVPFLSSIRFHVDAEAQKGFPKNNPTYYDNTAFHKVAESAGLSPQYVFDLYYKK